MAMLDRAKKSPLVSADRQNRLFILSFRLMRRIVGVLGLTIGLLLPLIALFLGECYLIQESISDYYYTVAGDVFVGLLCAVGFFLILYPGSGQWEDIWTNIAGICALSVAFFPTSGQQLSTVCHRITYTNYKDWVNTVHLSSAAAFFLILGSVALFQFPKSLTAEEDPIKRRNRNRFYRICGVIMWVCILILSPMALPNSDAYSHFLATYRLVFILEVVALVAFGTCWLVKGVTLPGSIERGISNSTAKQNAE